MTRLLIHGALCLGLCIVLCSPAPCQELKFKFEDGDHEYLLFSPDGKTLASVMCNESFFVPRLGRDRVSLWNLVDGKRAFSREFAGADSFFAFSEDSATFLVQKDFARWETLDVATGKTKDSFDKDIKMRSPEVVVTGLLRVPRFAVRGDFSMTAGPLEFLRPETASDPFATTKLVLIGMHDKKTIATFTGHTNMILAMSFSPKDDLIASGSVDKTVRLWDLKTRKAKAVLKGHKEFVGAVTFSADGKRLASSSEGETIIWDVATAKEIAKIPDSTFRPSLDQGGDFLALANKNDVVIWNVRSATRACTLKGHAHEVGVVRFSPSGSLLASVDEARNIFLWNVASLREAKRGGKK